MVNGRAGRRICHARGLCQGDPLSPMLFVIVMEVLNALILAADQAGQFTPLPGDRIKFRTSIYADDLVVFLAPSASDFSCLRAILDLFAGASGLLTNFDKCVMSPIQCSDDQVAAIQSVFPCSLAPFPCSYLGAPLSLRKLRRTDEQPLIDAVAARIPTWKADLLNEEGNSHQINPLRLPVHISITCCLSSWAIQEIDRRLRAFLWSGTESTSRGKCKVAWQIACAPKEYGGLGMPDLRIMGFTLRLRWEWLKRTEVDSTWASLPAAGERLITAMSWEFGVVLDR